MKRLLSGSLDVGVRHLLKLLTSILLPRWKSREVKSTAIHEAK